MAIESITVRMLDRAAPAKDGKPFNLGGQSLTPGRVVKATVVGADPGGKGVLVRMLGTTVLAESHVPLRSGQSLTLTVDKTEPQLVLTLGGQAAGKAVSRLPTQLSQLLVGRQSLPQSVETVLKHDLEAQPPPTPEGRQAAEKLQNLVREMVVDPSRADAKQLKEMITLSGQNLEARLAKTGSAPPNLRVMAEEVVRELARGLGEVVVKDPGQAAALREFMQAAQGLKSWSEANQGANAELLPKESLMFLAVPLAMGDYITQGELLLGLPGGQEGEGGEGETNLVFFLELSALGPLTVEATLGPKRVRAEFLTDSPDKAAFITEGLAGLKQRLADEGFEAVLGARVRPAAQQEADSPLATLIRRRGHYLSLTV